MKHYFYPLLKSFCITLGLNGALFGYAALFTLLVEEPFFQALLFFCVAICPVVAVCLFANIHAEKRRTLWLCAAVSIPLHMLLSLVSMLLYGFIMAKVWSSDLAPILIMLMAITPWTVAVFAITVIRAWHIGRERREAKRRLRRLSKGLTRVTLPVSPFRAGFTAVCRGILWTAWLHLSTGLLLVLLQKVGIADTMLAYIAFPILWCLMAAAYGLFDRTNRVAYAVSAAVCHPVLCVGSLFAQAYLYSARFETYAFVDPFFVRPFNYPELLLTLTLFFVGGIAMTVFGIGHRKGLSDARTQP